MPVQTADDRSQLENPMEIPKELWMMIDYLYRNAIRQVGWVKAVSWDCSQAALRTCMESVCPKESVENFSFPRGECMFGS